MIPSTFVLKPGLMIHSVHNGYWFWGRPSFEDLRGDLREVSPEIRPTETWPPRDSARHGVPAITQSTTLTNGRSPLTKRRETCYGTTLGPTSGQELIDLPVNFRGSHRDARGPISGQESLAVGDASRRAGGTPKPLGNLVLRDISM